MKKPRASGFIALISAIIIAVILLLAAVTGGLTGIFSRGDALDAELKARSVAAADACADEAMLSLANDPSYAGGDIYSLNPLDMCRVGAVAQGICAGRSGYAFKVQATSSNAAVTDLAVCVDRGDLSVISWAEVPNF